MSEEQPLDIIIYTDGACSPNPGLGGWAAILSCPSRKQEIVKTGNARDTTNNRMELTAAVEGLTALKRPCKVTVFTDSQYIANAFNQNWIANWQKNGWKTSAKKPVANDDLWKLLIAQNQRHTVSWQWVKGHENDEINERCDRLAVEARLKLENT